MRKNKGYQKDIHKVSWRTKKQSNSYASGENKSIEQCLKEIDENFDRRIKHAKNSYAFIAKKTTLEGKDLIDHCHDLMMWEIIIPQALRSVAPALVNEVITILKSSSLVATIGLMDMMRAAQSVQALTYRAFEPFIAVAAIYYVIVMVLVAVSRRLERRLKQN